MALFSSRNLSFSAGERSSTSTCWVAYDQADLKEAEDRAKQDKSHAAEHPQYRCTSIGDTQAL